MNSVPTPVWDRVPMLSPGDLTILIFIIFCAVVVTIAIIASTIYAMHKNRLEDTLKRELLDRGMNADEIATVISAKPSKAGLQRPTRT